jgi:4-alpha-glucanotransferase
LSVQSIRSLARRAGISTDWIDARGTPQRIGAEPLTRILAALGYPCATPGDLADSRALIRDRARTTFPSLVTATVNTAFRLPMEGSCDMPAEIAFEDGTRAPVNLRAKEGMLVVPPIAQIGYHRLRVAGREVSLAIAPSRCLTIADVAKGEKLWGTTVQLYSLRRAGDGGIGDTTALQTLARRAAHRGADAIALSPTHSLFAADHSHFGPYSPSNRLFLNPVYADPADSVAGVRAVSPQPEAEEASLIDWPQAARHKYGRLRTVFEGLPAGEPPEFERFIREGGTRLREQAVFEAIHAHWTATDGRVNWHDWPADWHGPSASASAHFAATHATAIRYHLFLQWIAARSFECAQAATREAGMRIGLIADLAVGMDPAGSHAWGRPADLLTGLRIGAPPDIYNPPGQNWGLVGFSPRALLETGFEPYIATLRATLRYAGGVRIDHAMGLGRLWLIPEGSSAADGAYVNYPIKDLLRLLALESQRHRAIVIAEDLGTVEPEFRDSLVNAGIGGMDVLWFQRDGLPFQSPSSWRADAVAMTTTHDLPTVAGWWSGADIDVRAELGLAFPNDFGDRARDRGLLWDAFRTEGVTKAEMPQPEQSTAVVEAALAFVARSPSSLVLAPIEDLLGLRDQPNLPGTTDQHPNWRRRLPLPVDSLLDRPDVVARVDALARNRK